MNPKEPLNKSFDKLRTNGNVLIPFMVSLSKHEYKRLVQTIPKSPLVILGSMLVGAGMAMSVAVLANDERPHSMAGHSEGSMALHQVMAEGQKMPMTMTGDVDRDFATMMIAHHQQAIRMADVLLQHGKHADLKAMASKMKAAQQKEIQALKPHTK